MIWNFSHREPWKCRRFRHRNMTLKYESDQQKVKTNISGIYHEAWWVAVFSQACLTMTSLFSGPNKSWSSPLIGGPWLLIYIVTPVLVVTLHLYPLLHSSLLRVSSPCTSLADRLWALPFPEYRWHFVLICYLFLGFFLSRQFLPLRQLTSAGAGFILYILST